MMFIKWRGARGLEYLSVTLTEVPKKWESKFPPYAEEAEHGKHPLMFWYPPAPLPYEPEKLVQKKPFLSMPRIFHLNKMNPTQVRTEITEKLMKGVASNKEMFTGECEWPFRVKICGLEGIYNLYTEAFWGNAVKNGEDTPAYVIMPKAKEKGKDKSNRGRSRSTNSYFRKSSLPLLNRKQKSSSRTSLSSRNALQALASSAHINHGPSCYIPQDLSAQFRLPFTPYVLSFEVMLLYGDSILRPSCYKQIKFYPFQYYSRFYQLVDLKIKISELPKETRLGINIYTVGHSGVRLGY